MNGHPPNEMWEKWVYMFPYYVKIIKKCSKVKILLG